MGECKSFEVERRRALSFIMPNYTFFNRTRQSICINIKNASGPTLVLTEAPISIQIVQRFEELHVVLLPLVASVVDEEAVELLGPRFSTTGKYFIKC